MDIKNQFNEYGIIPNKALGQNFLTDDTAADIIVKSADVDGRAVLEIGAGLGALTHKLNAVASRLEIVEIDKVLVAALERMEWSNPSTLHIIHSDFLKVNMETLSEALGAGFCVVANLPYYVTTPICMRLLQSGLDIESMTLMMQKEAAPRFTAPIGSKLYGPLSVLTDYLFDVTEIMELTPASYFPQPDVHSVVLHLSSKHSDLSCVVPLARMLKAAFSMRRKTILNNLSALGLNKNEVAQMLDVAQIPTCERAERLSTQDFLRLISV